MKDWKFIKIGNTDPKVTDVSGKYGSGIVERMSNLFFVSYKLNNGEKGIEKFPTEAQAVAFLKKKVGNESIEKQEWSMFNGLRKDAEKEIGNEKESVSWEIRKEYIQEIYKLEKKAEKLRRMGQGYEAAKVDREIKQMEKELRELGNKKIGNFTKNYRYKDFLITNPDGYEYIIYLKDGVTVAHIARDKVMAELWCDAHDAKTGKLRTLQPKSQNKKTGNKKYHVWTDSGNWDMVVSEEELENLKTTYKNFHYEEVK